MIFRASEETGIKLHVRIITIKHTQSLNKKVFSCNGYTWISHPDNPLTDLQDRQRAPLKQLRRCLENHTRTDSSMSEHWMRKLTTGHLKALPIHLPIRINAWSTSENDSQD
jgi:hypothetical protein